MKNIKRIIAFMLLIMVLMGESALVHAEETQMVFTTENGLTYVVDDNNQITITGYSGTSSYMEIPDTIKGDIVTSIGAKAFLNNNTIETVELPTTLKSLGKLSFWGCENLTEIEIPKSVEMIGSSSFQACYSLRKVIIYEGTELEDIDLANIIFDSYKSGFKIYGYKDSPAEAYATKWEIPFAYNEWIPLTDIILPEEITININQKIELPTTFTPENAYVGFRKADKYTLTGNGDADVEIDKDGRVYLTGTKVGTNQLSLTKYADYEYINEHITSNICKINIVDPSIIDATALLITDRDGNVLSDTEKVVDTYTDASTFELNATMMPVDANEMITFTSSKPYRVKVSQKNGVWNAKVYSGSTDDIVTITACTSRTGLTSSFKVKATYSGAKSLKFNTENLTTSGETIKLVNHGTYSMPLVVNPSSLQGEIITNVTDPSVLTYDVATGIITPLKAGTTTIEASVRGKNRSITVVVSEYELNATSITFATDDKLKSSDTNYNLSLNVGETYKLGATMLPADTTDLLDWYYDAKNLTVVEDGTIKALKAGTTTLYAYTVSCFDANSMKAVSGNVTITITDPNAVVEPPKPEAILAKDIQLIQNDCEMKIGDVLQLTTVLTPSNTTETPTYKSSDTSVATVSETGLVTVVGSGTVSIVAQIRGILDIIDITVKKEFIPPTLTLNASSLNLKQGENYTLLGTVTGNTKVSKILWDSTNANVADIKEDGTIVANNAGTTTITGLLYCLENGNPYQASCIVTVTGDTAVKTPITVQSVSLNTTSLSLEYGKSSTLNSSLNPQGATGTISWVSNNVSVATVNNGVVTAQGAGTCLITASCNGASMNCTVSVAPGSIQLNASKFNLQKGKTTKALAISSSSYENDNIVSVISSDPKVLKASFSGNQISLKGLKTSNKYVTVTVQTQSGATSNCQVKVVKDKVTTSKLTINKKSVTLSKGASDTLTVTQTPISSTDKLTWSSSNKKVVTVNKNGKIVAKKKGSATITLKSSNGKKVTCNVKVK